MNIGRIAQSVVEEVLFKMEKMSVYETNILLDARGDSTLRTEYDIFKNELVLAAERVLEEEAR